MILSPYMCHLKADESAFVKDLHLPKLLGLLMINLYFAIIFLHLSLSAAFGRMDHSFLLPMKSHFPLLNVDFYRPELQNTSRHKPRLEAISLAL